jgi:hypothetical protein
MTTTKSNAGKTSSAKSQFDFRTDGPPLCCCDLCGRKFKAWEVTAQEWKLIPPRIQKREICEEDYLTLVEKAGHDPSKINITHQTWDRMLAGWAETKDAPAHHAKIYFEAQDSKMPSESMWCEVLQQQANGQYVVRLQNTSFFSKTAKLGALYLASWDGGTVHGISGRPLFTPIRHLRALPGKKRKPTGKKKGAKGKTRCSA